MWGSEGEVEKITSIYTHFHFSLANVAIYWVLLRKSLLSVRHVCMCVFLWHVWTMGRLSWSPSCPNPPWWGWITHLILGSFSLAHSFSHSPFSPLPKGWDKSRPVLLPFCLCVCVCSRMCVYVVALSCSFRKWCINGHYVDVWIAATQGLSVNLGLHDSVCVCMSVCLSVT